MSSYAVNLADLTTCAQQGALNPVMLILRPFLSEQVMRAAAGRWDESGIVLVGEEERLEAAIHLIRLKVHKNQLRIYESKSGKGGWRRI